MLQTRRTNWPKPGTMKSKDMDGYDDLPPEVSARLLHANIITLARRYPLDKVAHLVDKPLEYVEGVILDTEAEHGSAQ